MYSSGTVTPVESFGTSVSLLTKSLVLFMYNYFESYDFLLLPHPSVPEAASHSHSLY